jgi:hypothetical protein
LIPVETAGIGCLAASAKRPDSADDGRRGSNSKRLDRVRFSKVFRVPRDLFPRLRKLR